MQPLAHRVLVQPDKAEEKTKGGILIPDTAREKLHMGTVLAAGKGKKDEPMMVKAGDRILYGKYSGIELIIEEMEVLMMKEADIFGIIKDLK